MFFGAYWRTFSVDRFEIGWPSPCWHTRHIPFIEQVGIGDYLALFVAGESFGGEEPKSGYLAQVMKVADLRLNDDGLYPRFSFDDFPHRVIADPACNSRVETAGSPIWFDGMARARSTDPELHFGMARQGVWRLERRTIAHIVEQTGIAFGTDPE